MIIGCDISFWQDDNSTPQKVDFALMKKAGAEFVFLRTGQGIWHDGDFADYWRDAKQAGMPRGSYWFYDSRYPPKRQAELWVSLFPNNDYGELPMWCDFEDNYGGEYGSWRDWYVFIERVRALLPDKEIGIYTGYYYWMEHMELTTVPIREYFHQFALWIARYNSTEPLIPSPWDKNEWTFWQYTPSGDGALYGVESKEIDLNYFKGTIEEFRTRFGLSVVPNEASKIVATFGNKKVEYQEIK